MNFVKTTALLTLLTLTVMFAAAALGFDLVTSIFFAFLFNFIMYFYSGSLAIRSTGAKPLADGQFPEVVEIITRLSKKENMPLPELYVIQSDQPNAFATGRNPKKAKVAVTTGIMSLLNRDELEGVLAHELSHIKNRDILVSSIAANACISSFVHVENGFLGRRQ